MNLLPGTGPKKFSLLSIGQRGVGKTVFLAGSYTELHLDSQTEGAQQLWFDCQDTQAQENIDSIRNYVAQTGHYPPLTVKITDFNFSLKRRHSLWGAQTLCHFRWWDVPGEICKMHNQDFTSMVSTSHGCCVFIDAYALVHNPAYLQALEEITEQIMAIACLVTLNRLKYAFAVILTKCDLLEIDPLSLQQLKLGLQPLTTRLDGVKANYQTFYSSIPIVHTATGSTLRAKGAAAPFLWLVWELSLAHNPGLINNLLELVTSLLPSGLQPQQELAEEGSLQKLFSLAGKPSRSKKLFGLYLVPSTRRAILILVLAITAAVGIISPLFIDYKQLLQRQPKNLDALENIDNMQLRGQFYQAISLMEQLVLKQPDRVDLRLQLAKLYEFTGQVSKAETAYDQVLVHQKNNLKALVGLAMLRHAEGDIKTAEALFAQAEKAAPTDLKAQVHAAAQNTLHKPAKQMPDAK